MDVSAVSISDSTLLTYLLTYWTSLQESISYEKQKLAAQTCQTKMFCQVRIILTAVHGPDIYWHQNCCIWSTTMGVGSGDPPCSSSRILGLSNYPLISLRIQVTLRIGSFTYLFAGSHPIYHMECSSNRFTLCVQWFITERSTHSTRLCVSQFLPFRPVDHHHRILYHFIS